MSRFASQSNSDSLHELITLVTSPDEYLAKLNTLAEKERAAQEQIALAGTAGEIMGMRAQCERELAESNAILAKAHDDAAAMRAKTKADCDAQLLQANRQCSNLLEETKSDCDHLKAEAHRYEEQIQERVREQWRLLEEGEARLTKKEMDLGLREAAILTREAELQAMVDHCELREKELDDETARVAIVTNRNRDNAAKTIAEIASVISVIDGLKTRYGL